MKKLFLLLAFLVAVTMADLGWTAPVGNLASPKLLSSKWLQSEESSIKAGGEIDLVLDGKLEGMDDTELNFYSAKIGLTLADKVDVYGILGAADGEYEETYDSTKVSWETETEFAWGMGCTVLLHEFENGIILGFDGKYRITEPDVDRLIVGGTTYDIPSGSVTNVSIEHEEWQVALGLAKQFGMFIPYGGVKYSDAEATMRSTVSGTTYSSEGVNRADNVGIFVGCDIVSSENILLNAEGRFIDEEAVSFAATIKF